MAVLRVEDLPEEPLAAAAVFHAEVLPRVATAFGADPALVLVLGPADHTHRGWRVAAVGSLARAWAPRRVNAVAGAGDTAIAEALAFLETAAAVTGQVLVLDGTSGATVVNPHS